MWGKLVDAQGEALLLGREQQAILRGVLLEHLVVFPGIQEPVPLQLVRA